MRLMLFEGENMMLAYLVVFGLLVVLVRMYRVRG